MSQPGYDGGAGIQSSIGESAYCHSVDGRFLPFKPGRMVETPIFEGHFQRQYFVMDNFSRLAKGIREWTTVVGCGEFAELGKSLKRLIICIFV
ncbi:MAG: hypothetical protein JST42_04635 [Bacteroidetes bacterium]|nr:hypothetical protein [Bacteroidota bacterium]